MLAGYICETKLFRKIEEGEIKESLKKKQAIVWSQIEIASTENISLLRDVFKIHPTTIEDVFSEQTPIKYEEFEDYKVVIFKGIQDIKGNSVETYNICFLVGENFIVTVCPNKEGTIKDLLRNEKKIENLLRKGKNYLMHHILDKEVDKYLKLKSEQSEELKQVEKEFMTVQSKEVLTKMYSQELDFLELRHLCESITDLCSNLMKHSENKEDNSLIPYFKDIYDHALKTTDGYESMLKRMDGMEELYATITTMKTNEVMRSLTIITAIMMPLTVITGFYGMNVHLPFQESPLASSAILGGMFALVVLMIIISKRAGWISKKNKE